MLDLKPIPEQYDPAAQLVQELDPPVENEPRMQAWQLDAPDSVHDPASHWVQTLTPAPVEKVPAAQPVHALAPPVA